MPISFTLPIRHGANRLHLAPPPPRLRPPHQPRISIRTINIRDGRIFGIAQVVRVVDLGGFELMVLTKTKISIILYCQNWLGYDIVCLVHRSSRSSIAQGGMVLVSWDRPMGWSLESTRFYRPNVVSCEDVRGTSRTPNIGSYLPPTTMDHLPDLDESLESFRVQDPILKGYLNVDLDEAQNPRRHIVAKMLT